MRVAQLAAVAASLASVGHAFLLPPTIASHHGKVKIPVPQILAEKQVVEIPCFGCPVQGMTKAASAETRSFLRFNLTVAHNADADAFLLNEHQVYPFDPFMHVETFTAEQFVSSPSGIWHYAGAPVLDFQLRVTAGDKSSPLQDLGLVSIRLMISSIGDSQVLGYPVIATKLLETPSGGLMIGDIQILPSQSTQPTQARPGSECKSMICSWKAYIGAKLSKLGGCGGMRAQQHGQHGEKSPGHHDGHHGGHHHRPGHDSHRHHHEHSGVAKVFKYAVWRVLIPAILGCIAGVIIVSLVGIVAHILAFFLYRHATRDVEEALSDDEDDDATKSFIQHQDEPPVYEEAPAYQESVDSKTAA